MYILIFTFLDSGLEGRTVLDIASVYLASVLDLFLDSLASLLVPLTANVPPFKYLQTSVGPVFRYCDGLPVEGASCERR